MKINEGIGSIAASKLADLATGFIFKARPVVIFHNTTTNSTVTLKLKRGLINHTLSSHEEGKGTKLISKSPSALYLITKILRESRKLFSLGFIEI